MKAVDPRACKGNTPYYTFLGGEAVEALRNNLDERRRQGGIEDEILFYAEADVVPPDGRPWITMSDGSLQMMVKRVARKAEIRKAEIKRWRHITPRSLRPAFESASKNTRLDVKDQEFLMGHMLNGSQGTYYDGWKPKI
jgi:integrase